jgi:hypothetical protein
VGESRLWVVATDAAGNTATSNEFTVTVVGPNEDDTSTPDAPVINNFFDDVGATTGYFNSGSTTDDSTPTLHGTAAAGSVVKIYEGSTVLGSVTADGSGNWEYTTPAQADGSHTFTATATSASGNTSAASAGFVVDVDTYVGPPVLSENAWFESYTSYNNQGGGDIPYSTVSASGVTVSGNLCGTVAPSNLYADPGGQQYFVLKSGSNLDIKFTKGSTESTMLAIDDPSYRVGITCYNDEGKVISSSDLTTKTVPNYGPPGLMAGLNIGLLQITALHGERIASITLTNIAFFGGLSWAPPRAQSTYASEAAAEETHTDLMVSDTHHTAQYSTSSIIQLSADDLIAHAQQNQFIQDGKLQFAVIGEQGEVVQLSETAAQPADWLHQGQVTSGGVTYDMYLDNVSNVEMLVQKGVTVLDENGHSLTPEVAMTGQDIENAVADMTGSEHTALTLTLDDILSHAQQNMFIRDGHQQLAVTGDAGDTVELKVSDLSSHEWTDAGQTTAGGVTYEVYQHTGSDVELLVQQGVELHQVV